MKFKHTLSIALSICFSANVSAAQPSNNVTFADETNVRAITVTGQKKLDALDQEISQHERRRDLANAKLEALAAEKKLKEQELAGATPKATTSSSTSNAEQEKVSEFDRQLQKADSLISELEEKLFLVDLYSIAGKVEGVVLTRGSSIPVERGTLINNKWRVESISMSGIFLTNASPKEGQPQSQFLSLKSLSEAKDSISQALTFRKNMIEARIDAAQQNALGATSMPMMNDSPTPGLIYE